MKICFLYRTKGVSFSIEKVFKQIRSALDKNIEQSDFYCPFNSYKNPLTYIRNFAALRRKSADIFHITGAVHYLALFLPARKTIITVHDLGHAFKTKGIVGFFLRQLFAILPLKKAKYIVAISNFSKNEIVENVGISPDKIKVIYDPAPINLKFKPKSFNFENPRILCFCYLENKNLDRHIQALKGIKCHLRIIGKLSQKNIDLLKECGTDYSNDYNISEEQILKEYEDCDMLLFASTYEGFGVPILEAQITGRPVVTSNISPMDEVTGRILGRDSAISVNPFDIKDIRNGILKLLDNPRLAEEIVQKGLENTQRFSVVAIAKQYQDLYERILKEK